MLAAMAVSDPYFGVAKAHDLVMAALADSHVDRLPVLTIEKLLGVTDGLAPDRSGGRRASFARPNTPCRMSHVTGAMHWGT